MDADDAIAFLKETDQNYKIELIEEFKARDCILLFIAKTLTFLA